MTIIIDKLAGSCELVRYPPWKDNPAAILGDLRDADGKPCGDVRMAGIDYDGSSITVGVEVKSIPDALTSMENGRLQGTQLRRMANTFDECWLAVYGKIFSGPNCELMGRHGTLPYTLGARPVSFGYYHGFAITLPIFIGLEKST